MIAFVTLIAPHFRTVSYVRSAFADFFFCPLITSPKSRPRCAQKGVIQCLIRIPHIDSFFLHLPNHRINKRFSRFHMTIRQRVPLPIIFRSVLKEYSIPICDKSVRHFLFFSFDVQARGRNRGALSPHGRTRLLMSALLVC